MVLISTTYCMCVFVVIVSLRLDSVHLPKRSNSSGKQQTRLEKIETIIKIFKETNKAKIDEKKNIYENHICIEGYCALEK